MKKHRKAVESGDFANSTMAKYAWSHHHPVDCSWDKIRVLDLEQQPCLYHRLTLESIHIRSHPHTLNRSGQLHTNCDVSSCQEDTNQPCVIRFTASVSTSRICWCIKVTGHVNANFVKVPVTGQHNWNELSLCPYVWCLHSFSLVWSHFDWLLWMHQPWNKCAAEWWWIQSCAHYSGALLGVGWWVDQVVYIV